MTDDPAIAFDGIGQDFPAPGRRNGNPHMKTQAMSARDHNSESGAGKAWSMTSSWMPLCTDSQPNKLFQAPATAGLTEYIRALATYVVMTPSCERLGKS
jgi:hypothetical protein